MAYVGKRKGGPWGVCALSPDACARRARQAHHRAELRRQIKKHEEGEQKTIEEIL